MLFSEAPNNVKSGVFSGKKTAIRTRLVISVIVIPAPMALGAFSVCYAGTSPAYRFWWVAAFIILHLVLFASPKTQNFVFWDFWNFL